MIQNLITKHSYVMCRYAS